MAVLVGLSGVDARSHLAFQLAADRNGISHAVGVSKPTADSVTAELRAAVPSLRYTPAQPPVTAHPTRQSYWQLAPEVASLRTERLDAIAASLLASLWPLAGNETVQLTWHFRPAVRPRSTQAPTTALLGAERRARERKLRLPGFAGYGELSATATSRLRANYLLSRTSSVLRSLDTPFGHLVGDPPLWGKLGRLLGRRGRYFSAEEIAAVIGWPINSPELPGIVLGAARRLLPSGDLPTTGRLLGTSDFPGVTREVALSPTAATRGLYILGPTGSGKTSLIKNLVVSDMQQGRGLCVVETNGDLITDLLDLVPSARVQDVVLLDPTDPEFAVGFNPLVGSDPELVADQITELFERLWKSSWGPRTAQLAHMSLLTLARRQGNAATLLNVARLLTDPQYRATTVADLNDPLGLEPDWAWFSALPSREAFSYAQPLLNKLRQFTARPAIRSIVGQQPRITLAEVVAEQKILLVNLPKGLLGADTARLLGCLILTSVWQAAAARAALPLSRRRPFGLYVDEVQDFAAAPIPWAEMFAQGRKYGLAVTVAHQNTQQIESRLLETILANARSKAVFALSATDARILARSFAPYLTAADLQALDAYTIAALVALDDGSVARPVTLTTSPPPQPTGNAALVRKSSQTNYGRPRAEVETALRNERIPKLPPGPIGSQPRQR